MNKLFSLFHNVIQITKRRIIKTIFVIFRDEALSVDTNSFTTRPSTVRKPVLLVLGCAHYYEKVESYHLKNVLDLHKILKLEQQSSDDFFLYKIAEYDGKSRTVTKAFIKLSSLELLPAAHLIIPESWLISEQLNNEAAEIEYSDKNFVFLPKNLGYSFIEQTGFLKNVSDALSAVGAKQTLVVNQYDDHWLNKMVSSITTALKFTLSIPGLRPPNKHKVLALNWRNIAYIFFGILLTYFASIHFFLSYTQSQAKEQSALLNKKLTPIFDQLSQNRKNIELVNVLASFEGKTGWEVDVWTVIKPLLSKDIKILNVNFLITKRIAVRANTTGKSASEILKEVLQQPLVNSAQFSGRVNKRKNSEDFTIIIEVKDGK